MQIYRWQFTNTIFNAQEWDQVQRTKYESYSQLIKDFQKKGRKTVHNCQVREGVLDHCLQWTPCLIIHFNWKVFLLLNTPRQGIDPRCTQSSEDVQSWQKSSYIDGWHWCWSLQWYQNIWLLKQRVEKHWGQNKDVI